MVNQAKAERATAVRRAGDLVVPPGSLL